MNTWPATHMTNKKRSFKNNANKKCISSLPEKEYMTFFATMIWPSNLKSLQQRKETRTFNMVDLRVSYANKTGNTSNRLIGC